MKNFFAKVPVVFFSLCLFLRKTSDSAAKVVFISFPRSHPIPFHSLQSSLSSIYFHSHFASLSFILFLSFFHSFPTHSSNLCLSFFHSPRSKHTHNQEIFRWFRFVALIANLYSVEKNANANKENCGDNKTYFTVCETVMQRERERERLNLVAPKTDATNSVFVHKEKGGTVDRRESIERERKSEGRNNRQSNSK